MAKEGGNTKGLGAKLKIFTNGKIQTLEQNPARGYLSSVSFLLHFGVGKENKIDSLKITWGSGKVQTLYNIKANQLLKLDKKNAIPGIQIVKPVTKWFT